LNAEAAVAAFAKTRQSREKAACACTPAAREGRRTKAAFDRRQQSGFVLFCKNLTRDIFNAWKTRLLRRPRSGILPAMFIVEGAVADA